METLITINGVSLSKGDTIQVQEPTQKFSHDVYIVNGYSTGMLHLETYEDGIGVLFPVSLMEKSKLNKI